MTQISLKINKYVSSVGVVNNNLERLIFNVILGSFGVLALLYILFLGNMVLNIVERRSLDTDARALASEVGNLEFTYLTMSNNVDLTFSYSLGFKETQAVFATRKALSLGSINTPFDNVKIAQNDL